MVSKNESVCTEPGTSTKYGGFVAEGSLRVEGVKYVHVGEVLMRRFNTLQTIPSSEYAYQFMRAIYL